MTKIIFAATNLTIALTSGTTNIAAESLELTVDGQKRASAELPELLKALLAGAGLFGQPEGTVAPVDAIAFIKANPHARVKDVAEHFGMTSGAAASMLVAMTSHGVIKLSGSADADDGDDATFVSADYEAPAAAAPVEEAASSQVPETSSLPSIPEATTDNVLAFLRSDDRFEYRTYSSVNKRFGGSGVDSVLGALIAAGQVVTKRRRADGRTLYKAVVASDALADATASTIVAAVAASDALADATAAAPATTELTGDAVLAFLRSDSRYTLRSQDAIAKHFGDHADNDVGDVIDTLFGEGKIDVKRRRADGETLYYAIAEEVATNATAEAQSEGSAPQGSVADSAGEAEAPELNVENIRSFISADPRYTQRTRRAIAKHFGVDSDVACHLLEGMIDDGDLTQVYRRRDDEPLYSLA